MKGTEMDTPLSEVRWCAKCNKRPAANRRTKCCTCRTQEWRERNPGYAQSAASASRARIKAATIAAYGGACSCCGESEPMFLCLDHIDGGGTEHRRSIFGQIGGSMWAWAKRNGYPDTLRLLCFNCNSGREQNGGVCPHQVAKERTA